MANNLFIKVNLARLDGASLQTNPNTGKRAIIIPVDDAHLFVGDKGGVFLDLAAWENSNGVVDQYGNTHSVKQSFSKELRESLGMDAIKAKPYLGNAKPIPSANNGNNQQAATQAPTQQSTNWDNW